MTLFSSRTILPPMFETGKKEKAAKRAYEIAYAIFRIAAKFDDAGIRGRFESYAIDLLISAKTEEYGNAAKAVAAIDCLVKFAIDLNILSIANGDVLLREVNNMNEEIAECIDKTDEEVDASLFFSEDRKETSSPTKGRLGGVDFLPSSEGRLGGIPEGVAEDSRRPREGEDPRFQSAPDSSKESGNVIKSGMRQIAILDKIRQSGNCKLKEIQEVLPDTSERTIRYDIEELIERNLIERIGSGGPAVSYRIRQISAEPAIRQ